MGVVRIVKRANTSQILKASPALIARREKLVKTKAAHRVKFAIMDVTRIPLGNIAANFAASAFIKENKLLCLNRPIAACVERVIRILLNVINAKSTVSLKKNTDCHRFIVKNVIRESINQNLDKVSAYHAYRDIIKIQRKKYLHHVKNV